MKVLTKFLSPNSARLLIGMPPPTESTHTPFVESHGRDHRGHLIKSPGALLGHESGHPYALTINIRIGDLITLSDGSKTGWHHFRIGADLEMLPLEMANRALTFRESVILASRDDLEPLKQAGSDSDELRAVLADDVYPDWMRLIIQRHILMLKATDPRSYFTLARGR